MNKEQREHMEAMLIDMAEHLPKQCFPFDGNRYEYSPDALRAAAEVTHALIALEKSAKVRVKVNNMLGGKAWPVAGKSLLRGFEEGLAEDDAAEPTEDEAWELTVRAIRNIRGNRARSREEEFAKLPPIVQKVLKRPDMLYEWGLVSPRMLDTEAQANFRAAFRELSAREEPRGKVAEMTIVLHVDTTELDEALAKAERLAETLRRAGSGE